MEIPKLELNIGDRGPPELLQPESSKEGKLYEERDDVAETETTGEGDALLSDTSRKRVLLLVTACVPRDTLFYLYHGGGALDSRRYLCSVRSLLDARVRLSPKNTWSVVPMENRCYKLDGVTPSAEKNGKPIVKRNRYFYMYNTPHVIGVGR